MMAWGPPPPPPPPPQHRDPVYARQGRLRMGSAPWNWVEREHGKGVVWRAASVDGASWRRRACSHGLAHTHIHMYTPPANPSHPTPGLFRAAAPVPRVAVRQNSVWAPLVNKPYTVPKTQSAYKSTCAWVLGWSSLVG